MFYALSSSKRAKREGKANACLSEKQPIIDTAIQNDGNLFACPNFFARSLFFPIY